MTGQVNIEWFAFLLLLLLLLISSVIYYLLHPCLSFFLIPYIIPFQIFLISLYWQVYSAPHNACYIYSSGLIMIHSITHTHTHVYTFTHFTHTCVSVQCFHAVSLHCSGTAPGWSLNWLKTARSKYSKLIIKTNGLLSGHFWRFGEGEQSFFPLFLPSKRWRRVNGQ